MSMSSNGEINYGILFKEDHEFPWSDDVEEWWREVNGYAPPFELFTEDGEYIGGVEPTKAQIDTYFGHRYEWDKTHPIPFELANYCSGECPMYIVAVRGTNLTARRGFPVEFDPAQLGVSHDQINTFRAFCKQYGLTGEPKWYLTSYWG